MDNRLQFRHNETVFPTREAAIEGFIKTFWENQDENALSLLAEPTVLLYENENDHDPFKKRHPHVILAIGANSNQDTTWNASRYCFIDVHDLYTKIKDNKDNLEAAVKALSAKALDSDSLYFYAQSSDSGTILSGDVRLAEDYRIYNESEERYETLPNNLIIANGANPRQKGIYMYVDIDYTEGDSAFTFTVSNSNNTITEKKVTLHDNYVVSGEYDIQEQAIKLYFKEGGEPVSIDCTNLINEWVADKGSKTPVILTKEEYKYETNPYTHAQKFQDVLSADIRIKDEILDENGKPKRDDSGHYMKTSGSTNILSRADSESQSLYVDGTASNIIYYGTEGKTNVKAELDKLNKLRISSDGKNIIVGKNDGFFASVDIEYEKKTKQVGSGYTVIQELILYYSSLDDEGKIVTKSKEVEIPIAQFIDDVYYDSTKEEIVIRYIDGKGDVKYTRIPVKDMIEEWDVYNENHSVKLKKDRSIAGKDLLSADVKIVNSSTLANNILEDRNHELYVRGEADNIKYNNAPNSETVKFYIDALSGKLDTEIADRIADVDEEEARAKDAENFLSGAIDSVSAITDASIQRIDEIIGSGFTRDPHDNITFKFEKEVADRTAADTALQNAINAEETRATNAENALRTDLTAEATRAQNAENALSDAINTEIQDRIADVNAEENRAQSAETALRNDLTAEIDNRIADINAEETRATNAENALSGAIDTEIVRATSAETALQTAITAEETRATNAENALSGAIDTEKTRATNAENALSGAIDNEINRATSAENALSGIINAEINNRTTADTALQTAITAEKTRAMSAETALQTAISGEIVRATNEDTRLNNLITAEIANRISEISRIEDKVDTATYSVDDTVTVDMKLENKVITSNVKIGTGETIMFVDNAAGGIRANVKLTYNGGTNVLMLEKTNPTGGTSVDEITLNAGSIIDSITYDSDKKELVIRYHSSSSAEALETRVNVSELFNEWICDSNHLGAIKLTKSIGTGTGGADVLSAETVISTLPSNILVNDNGTLYVDGTQVSANKEAISALTNALNAEVTRATSAEQGLRTDLTAEETRAKGIEQGLRDDLSAEINNRIADVNAEETRAMSAETALQTAINNEVTRATNKDSEHDTKISANETAINNEVTRATSTETTLQTAITTEKTRAEGVESALSAAINNLTSQTSTISASTLTIKKNGVDITPTYSPTGGSQSVNIEVPTSVTALSEYNSATNILTLPSLSVNGSVTATAVYSTSDINLKENIELADDIKKVAANSIDVKQFNFKDDPNKAKVYGIIAQDLEAKGLEDIVYTKDDGYKAVDYTSLMMLKIAYLEKENKELRSMIEDIQKKLG